MKNIIIFLIIGLNFKFIHAEKLDLATHNSLIQKLESASQLDSADSMILQGNLAYRLADLYAERARLLSIDLNGEGEKIHQKQITSDRQKSIYILNKILNTLEPSKQGTALLQIAHLHTLLAESDQTLKILNEIESNTNKYDNKTVSLVEIQLGDINFVRGDYDLSQKHFSKAISYKENPRLGYSLFRLAWIHYNQGQSMKAEKELVDLLRNRKLFINSQKKVDVSFQEEVSHDLATFMAKNDISSQSISNLTTLSPESARKENLIYLAKELDRTAKKNSALKIWKIIGVQNITFEEQIEKQIQITRIQYDLGNYKQVLKELDKAIALLKNNVCEKNSECVVAQQDLRHILTDWAKAEQRIPSADLILAFQKYTENYDDIEICYWAAESAYKRKQYKDSYFFHEKTVNLLLKYKDKNAEQLKIFEASLLGMIEVSELSKDVSLRLKSYQKYIENNPAGEKASEVRYQIAHWYYETNNYAEARSQFRALALQSNMPNGLKEKSGDLCLDSDVILKDESLIEQDSYKLAMSLPSKKLEYLNIYKKSIFNQAAYLLDSKSNSNYDVYLNQLNKLESIGLNNFLGDDLKRLYKFKISFAYRLKNLEKLSKYCLDFLTIKNLTQEDRNLALEHLSWIAEVQLNFKMALKYFSKIEFNSKDSKKLNDYFFKKALLKELAQENPTFEYEKYTMSRSANASKKQFAAHQIILFSKQPQFQFKKYEQLLRHNNDLYNSASLEVFEKTKDINFANRILKRKVFRNSLEGHLVSHYLAFAELQKIDLFIDNKKFIGQNDSSLKKSILKQQKTIKRLEALANKAIQEKDTTLQIVYLSKIAQANQNIAQNILAVPLPHKLSPVEKKQYQDQVHTLVEPYLTQAQVIQGKLSEIWQVAIKNEAFKSLSDMALQQTTTQPGSQLAAQERRFLIESARSLNLTVDVFEKLSEERRKTLSEASILHSKIQKNPFNTSDLAKLKELQISLGSGPLVAYLDSRLTEGQTH